MQLGGISIILWLGIVNLALIIFQIASGRRLIRVSPGTHRKTAYVLLITAILHGLLAYLVS